MKNMQMKITVGAAALALGALASAPAFAQGRNANDGGWVSQPSSSQLSAAPKATAQKPAAASYGRNPNDGGLVMTPSGAPGYAVTEPSTKKQSATRYGRNPNDGGLVEN